MTALLNDLISFTGDLFLRVNANRLEVLGQNISAALSVSGFEVGVSAASLALIVHADQSLTFQAVGSSLIFSSDAGLTATASSVRVQFNSSANNYTLRNQELVFNDTVGVLNTTAGSLSNPFVQVQVNWHGTDCVGSAGSQVFSCLRVGQVLKALLLLSQP